MSCRVASRQVGLVHAMPVRSRQAMSCGSTPCHVMSCLALPCHAVSWHAMSCHAIPGHAMS
eukprot:10664247-Alexandrium_andersonii.AAC.1